MCLIFIKAGFLHSSKRTNKESRMPSRERGDICCWVTKSGFPWKKKKQATADGVSDNNEKPQINNICIELVIYYSFKNHYFRNQTNNAEVWGKYINSQNLSVRAATGISPVCKPILLRLLKFKSQLSRNYLHPTDGSDPPGFFLDIVPCGFFSWHK